MYRLLKDHMESLDLEKPPPIPSRTAIGEDGELVEFEAVASLNLRFGKALPIPEAMQLMLDISTIQGTGPKCRSR